MNPETIDDFLNKKISLKKLILLGYYSYILYAHYIVWASLQAFFFKAPFLQFFFLTDISFYLNFFYYISRLLSELQVAPNFLHSTFMRGYFKFSFCLSFVVAVLFWGLLLTDPSLLNRGNITIPPMVNYFLHGANFGLNFFEHIFINSGINSKEVGMKVYVIFIVCYASLLEGMNFKGIVIYPFVGKHGIVGDLIVFGVGFFLILMGDFIFLKTIR